MAEQFQKVHDPFKSGGGQANNLDDIFGANSAVGQLSNEQDFFSQMAAGNDKNTNQSTQQNQNNDMLDFFNQINQGANTNQSPIIQTVNNSKDNNPLNAGLFNEDDILMTLGQGANQRQSQQQKMTSGNTSGFDQIFQAAASHGSSKGFDGLNSQGQGQGYQSKTTPMRIGSYDSKQTKQHVDNALKGRNLASEAISSERKKTMFQRYVFDSYKYQVYFNTTTIEIINKLLNGLWPFFPEDQPEELILDYKTFCRTVFGDQGLYKGLESDKRQTREEGGSFFTGHDVDSGVHNPFNKDNDTLSFLGRDLEKEDQESANQLKVNQYKRNELELYGPIWIFITLVVEFIILGHWSSLMNTQANTKSEEIMNLLLQKNRSATLQRIMKLTFFFACFFFGLPFGTYLQFKGFGAMEISYASLVISFGYSFIPFVPGSLFIFCLQAYGRVKYLSLIILWILLLFNIYKTTYEARRKYFDFVTNKQMAWYVAGLTFFYMWIFKSYFLQV